MEEIIKAQNEYIEFLEEHISKTTIYLQIHGMGTSDEEREKWDLLIENIKKAEESSSKA